jgi:DNA-binding protein YbaB
VTDSRPTIGEGIDWRLWRGRLVALRDKIGAATARAESDDGLISATVGGRGELLALTLDPRVFRVTDSRLLAERITRTVRGAVDQVRARVAADFDEILAERRTRR